MKKNSIIAFALIGGLTLLAASCVKEADMNEKYRPEGTPIIFTAATGFENGDGTRTEYSGHFFNGSTEVTGNTLSSYANTWERIDWVQNDPMVIYYDRASSSANYNVTSSISPTAEISDAGIEVASGSSKLTWAGGTGDHIFTAMYPKNGFGNNNSITFNGANGQVGGLIPATQTLRSVNGKYLPQMQYAYMVARKTIDGSSTQHTVALPFKPAFTAFEFRLRRPATLGNGSTASFKVKSFTISSSSPLAGNFNLTINGEDSRGATWSATPTVTNNGNKSNSVTVTFNGNTGVDLSTSADLDFTLLTLPTPIADLTLTLTFADASNTTKSITLKDSNNQPKSFVPCKKYIITNSNAGFDDWEYFLEEIDDKTYFGYEPKSYQFGVKSYKRSKANNSIKKEVPWKIQYSNDNGTTWTDVANDGTTGSGNPHTITGGNTGLGSYTTAEGRTANITGNATQTGTISASDIKTEMSQRSTRGTSSAPWDLSKHDIYGNSTDMTTANSYVVDHPGVYMIPCIYGNSVTHDGVNWASFRPGDANVSPTTASNYTNHYTESNFRWYNEFFDASNSTITHPGIVNNYGNLGATVSSTSAAIVWQNSMTGAPIVTSVSIVNVDPGLGSWMGTIPYIKFEVPASAIQPGNVVIAFRGTVTGNTSLHVLMNELPADTILWSWQIWITQNDLHPSAIGSASFMPRNLGAVDKTDYITYADRRIKYRVVQTETGGKQEEFQVEEIGPNEDASIGNNPFYQWGRKDPLVPVDPDGSDAITKITAGSRYSNYGSVIQTSGGTWPGLIFNDVMSAIQNPHRLCMNTYGVTYATWIGGPDYSGNSTVVYGYNYTNRGCLPYNLWNAVIYKTMDAGGSNKYKTIYDPCPPGFCVPNVGALSGFSTATQVFSPEGVTIGGLFFPYTGLRVYHPGAIDTENVTASGHFWTDCPEDENSTTDDPVLGPAWNPVNTQLAKGVSYNHTDVFVPRVDWYHPGDASYTRGSAFPVRPMVDPKY